MKASKSSAEPMSGGSFATRQRSSRTPRSACASAIDRRRFDGAVDGLSGRQHAHEPLRSVDAALR